MKFGRVVFKTCERQLIDKQTDKQTDRHTDTLIATLRTSTGGKVINL